MFNLKETPICEDPINGGEIGKWAVHRAVQTGPHEDSTEQFLITTCRHHNESMSRRGSKIGAPLHLEVEEVLQKSITQRKGRQYYSAIKSSCPPKYNRAKGSLCTSYRKRLFSKTWISSGEGECAKPTKSPISQPPAILVLVPNVNFASDHIRDFTVIKALPQRR